MGTIKSFPHTSTFDVIAIITIVTTKVVVWSRSSAFVSNQRG